LKKRKFNNESDTEDLSEEELDEIESLEDEE